MNGHSDSDGTDGRTLGGREGGAFTQCTVLISDTLVAQFIAGLSTVKYKLTAQI